MLPRQGPANGIVVMGYELIGTQDDKPVYYGLCYSDIMFTTFGASDGYTRIYCDWTGSHPLMSTTLYQALPANVDSTSVASQQAASSIPASNSNPSPTSSPAGEQDQPPGGSSRLNNTSVIAGSVVGGLAVIAFAGVAILYILKRSKRHSAGTPVPSSDGDSMNPYGTPEMTRNGYPDAQAYTHTATKYGHTINGGELDGQHGTAELGGVLVHEVEGRR
ncbi:hypothetical protein J4E86_006107 [Alternaria arbusti]|uniref:uncharacterized protein n=1 Tax=Alternaria arbusti TaxID=232088 RepID=UPI00221E5015|nr:uncharacterized protein J4E86_006107 [Alternaria arbusti]KAI4954797.1 hypothetical protein J4E86_006107 [Alternaria arbusti]